MSETETVEETGGDASPLAGMDADMAANPQPTFKLLRDEMPVLSIDIGSNPGVLLSRKEDIDFALRHTEIFSSNVDAVDLKNKRPMIPLQIDPPEHKKFRKLLDPIFAPRKMAAMDEQVSELVNHLIDGFIDRGEVDFAKEFSVPFPSEDRRRPRRISRRSPIRSTNTSTPSSTSARRSRRTTCCRIS
jgi:cytochrome P450